MAGYQEVDCRVYENDTHHSVFRDGDPPPFLDLKRRHNEDWTETITTAKRARGGNAPVVKVTEIVHKAYVGGVQGFRSISVGAGDSGSTKRKPLLAPWPLWL